MTVKAGSLVALTLFLGSCDVKEDPNAPVPILITAEGFKIAQLEDLGSFPDWVSIDEALAELDRWVFEWANFWDPDGSLGYLAWIRSAVIFFIHDDYKFPCEAAGFCAGQVFQYEDWIRIDLALWGRGDPVASRDLVPPAPEHTVRQNPADGFWSYANMTVLLPATIHELDHLVLGDFH